MPAWPKNSWRVISAVAVLTLPLIAFSLPIAKDDPALSQAERMPRAMRSVLLDISKMATGYVAVGERGHIVLSQDGKIWQQADVPTRATLTTVSVQGASIWAAGHDGVIVHSSDAGKTWQRQRVQPWSAQNHETTNGSAIIDSLFIDAKTGFMVGSYSLLLKTLDGGVTWQQISIVGAHNTPQHEASANNSGVFDDSTLAIGAESDPHLNAITHTASGTLIVMGERGSGFSSTDQGAHWQKIKLPYAGSMFGLLSLGQEKIIAFGLRGNVYESANAGTTWQKIISHTEVGLIGGSVRADGTVALVGPNGTLLERLPHQVEFTVKHVQLSSGQAPSLSGLTPNQDGYLLSSDLGTLNYRAK